MSPVSDRKHSLERKLASLPKRPGVYLFRDKAGVILYVGKAKSLRSRVRSYFGRYVRTGSLKVQAMVSKIYDLETIITDSEVEALILEANLVKEYRPKYNINLRDDKSYPYIRVTNEAFPRLFPTRKLVQDGSRYFGPYTDVNSMRDLLKTIKRIFPVRSCNFALTTEVIDKRKYKVCLDYHIKRCLGPCEGLIDETEYGKIIDYIVSFIDGRSTLLVADLKNRMSTLASQLRFEEAARLRDMLSSVQSFQDKQKIVTQDTGDRDFIAAAIEEEDSCGVVFKVREGKIIGRQHYYMTGSNGESLETVTTAFLQQYYLQSDYVPGEIYLACRINDQDKISEWLSRRRNNEVRIVYPEEGVYLQLINMCTRNAVLLLEELKLQKISAESYLTQAVERLQNDLHLESPPKIIEAFDISNIAGKEPVASMVYFDNGRPVKKEYRRFKIKGGEQPNDYAMMREALERRYGRLQRENGSPPDLIVVDGGKGQLNVAAEVMQKLELRIPLAALAKRLDEVFVPGFSEAQNIAKDSPGLRLLQRIRDESHRFAVQYHRTLRKKRTITSLLEAIPGVGPARRKTLMRAFKSLDGVRGASVDELSSVTGISQKLAEEIWSFFHRAGNEGT